MPIAHMQSSEHKHRHGTLMAQQVRQELVTSADVMTPAGGGTRRRLAVSRDEDHIMSIGSVLAQQLTAGEGAHHRGRGRMDRR